LRSALSPFSLGRLIYRRIFDLKTLGFGGECATLQNSKADASFKAPENMRVKGYSITLSMATATAPAFFGLGQAEISVALFSINYTPQVATPSVPFTVKQVGGSNPIGGDTSPTSDSQLVVAIMRHRVPGSRDIQLVKGDLDIPIAAGTTITCHVEHAGYASDWECQGILYYE
jgi:hypothetical protein